jgi:hypothetical protein
MGKEEHFASGIRSGEKQRSAVRSRRSEVRDQPRYWPRSTCLIVPSLADPEVRGRRSEVRDQEAARKRFVELNR